MLRTYPKRGDFGTSKVGIFNIRIENHGKKKNTINWYKLSWNSKISKKHVIYLLKKNISSSKLDLAITFYTFSVRRQEKRNDGTNCNENITYSEINQLSSERDINKAIQVLFEILLL